MSTHSRCLAFNDKGEPCGAYPRPNGYCLMHDPNNPRRASEMARKGGQAKSNRNRAAKAIAQGAKTTEEIEGLLGIVLTQVMTGKMAPGVANAIANVARAAMIVREKTTLEKDIEEIKFILEERKVS